MDRDRQTEKIVKYQPCGKRSQGRPIKDFLAVSGTGSDHEDYNPARYMIMAMTVSYQMWRQKIMNQNVERILLI
jgi:hypothetical protein